RQQRGLIGNYRPRRQRPALTISDFHAQVSRDSINRQEAQVMRRELVFDTRIAETDDQFHATIPIHAALGCPAGQSPAALTTELFLLLLLGLLGLRSCRSLGAFFLSLLLALLDDFRLGWGCRFRCRRFRS